MSLQDIKKAIHDTVMGAQGEKITSSVITSLAGAEIDRRVGIAVKTVAVFTTAQQNYDKVNKPDLVSYGANGQKTNEAFSKKRLDEINKAKGVVEKIEKLFADAIGEGAKWNELENYLKNPPKEVPDAATPAE